MRKEVKNKQEFLSFLSLYIEDFHKNKDDWENNTIDSFLEGMGNWVEDMDGYYANMKLPVPKDIDWQIFADILSAAKVYE